MENYQNAYVQRAGDTKALHDSGRKVAAIHFGGVTIECFLKAILLSSIPKGATPEWKTSKNSPGHSLTNPGHSFVEALKRQGKLYHRAQQSKHVMQWIEAVENPGGHFINMRYSCDNPTDVAYKKWFDNYSRLLKWISKQSTQL